MVESSRDETGNLERILLVEDEVLVRIGVAEFLRERGYRVQEASNAPEAVDLLYSGLSVDLVITDIYMPTVGGMDGFGLAQWMAENRPEIATILTSGVVRPIDLTSEHFRRSGPILVKPYTRQRLLDRIKEALSGRKPSANGAAA